MVIVAGFGCRASASADSLRDALEQARQAAGLRRAPDLLATAADKAQTTAFAELTAALERPLHAVAADAAARQTTLTRSAASEAARGTGSVAEAAALAAAGPGARLLAPRAISTDRLATCALAKGDGP